MSIKALYVYSPTTFKTDTRIEPMTGAPHPAGEVKLPPGVYRLPASANIAAAHGAHESHYSIVPLSSTKDGWPDPPQAALQQHDASAIRAFLTGTGHENEIS